MRTNQEIFDIAATHLLTQNKQSTAIRLDSYGRSQTVCLYRGPNGLMCGIGPFIPDEKYTPEMEGNSCTAWSVRRAHGLRPRAGRHHWL